VCSRYDDLWAFGCPPHFLNIDTDTLIARVLLARHLVGARQQRFSFVEADRDALGAGILNNAVDDFAFAVGVGMVGRFALCFTDALQNYLLRRLRGNASTASWAKTRLSPVSGSTPMRTF
jgi:hypothetical protein